MQKNATAELAEKVGKLETNQPNPEIGLSENKEEKSQASGWSK